LLRALGSYALEAGLRQAIHVAESRAEVDLIARGGGPFAEMFRRRGVPWTPPGGSPVAYLDACGALIPGTLAVHCVHVSSDDARRLAERGVAVAHCPKSNGKLAAGVAPVRALRDAGVVVGLGTDSVASNNGVDLFEEMRAAIFGARSRDHDAAALGAREALEMATRGGARALGLDGQTGSLAPGMRADLCVVRLDGLHVEPAAVDDPVAALVYSARAADVVLTMVGGRTLYEAEVGFPFLDVSALREKVRRVRRGLRDAAENERDAAIA
jgi:5-methylthioadenosine/S-adenosylhomocysteine deaminase